MKAYLLLLFIAAGVTWILTPVVRQAALSFGALTPVRERDVHTRPVARLGGIAMLGGFALTLLIGSKMPYFAAQFSDNRAWGVLGAAAFVCVLGTLDDLFDLDWLTKLAGQCLAGGIMAFSGVQMSSFPIFGVTIGSSRLSIAATVFIAVAAMNAVNFVDGLDGLAAGTIAIGGICFFIYTYQLTRMTNTQSFASLAAMIIIALVGICAGFLVHNFHPASIFMGDCGSMLLGTVVAGAAVIVTGQIDPTIFRSTQVFPALLPIILPVAVLLIPLLDMTMSVLRRVRAGKSPFHPDRMHLHHRLLTAGNSHRRAVGLMYSWAAGVGAISLAMMNFDRLTWALTSALIVTVVGLITFWPSLAHRARTRLGTPHRPPLHERRDREMQ